LDDGKTPQSLQDYLLDALAQKSMEKRNRNGWENHSINGFKALSIERVVEFEFPYSLGSNTIWRRCLLKICTGFIGVWVGNGLCIAWKWHPEFLLRERIKML